ncbi:hypothetical protein EG831_10690, partial [bacterium]|nr:hypothetical protein [bacterium]
MNDWNIQSRAHTCSDCTRAFADREGYHTLLFEARSELLRQDLCQACWDKQFSHGARDRKGFISYWQGVYEAPPPPTEALKRENAESLLRKIIELNEPRYGPAAFILAVMLERKRLLKVKDQVIRDGARTFVYEQPGTGDVFTIVDPQLQLNQLESVQRDVAELLEHGLPSQMGEPSPAVAGDGAEPTETAPADSVEASNEAAAVEPG